MSLLTGMTEAGQEVPVQVKPDGRLVAEGLTGPAGPAGPAGPSQIPAGTAAAPGLPVAGDPNTGLYSPGADQVAISTNGTGRLFVDASGNVGVGASSFVAGNNGVLLTPSTVFTYRSGTGERTHFSLSNDNGITGFLATNDFGINIASVDRMVFKTASTERMRLDSSGRLGLGTSSPFTTLHSFKSVTGGSPATSGTADANVIARFQGGSVGFDLGATVSGTQWIQPRKVNDFSVNYGLLLCPNGGNVGIGTTSPSELLAVSGKVSAHSLKLRSPDGSWWDLVVSDAGVLTVTQAALLKK